MKKYLVILKKKMICFNCNLSSDHGSINCPEPQKYSRCVVCRNVCFDTSSHRFGCTNAGFRSQYLAPTTTVFSTSVLVKLGFTGIEKVFVKDYLVDTEVKNEALFVFNENALVEKKTSS